MVDLKISLKKGFYTFVMGGLASILPLFQALPQDQAVYGCLTIGFIVGLLRFIQDALKHKSD